MRVLLLPCIALLFGAAPAPAQVTLDLHALDQNGKEPPKGAGRAPPAAARRPPQHQAGRPPGAQPQAKPPPPAEPAPPPAAAAPPPSFAPGPPAALSLPTITVPPPAAKPAPPPPPPVSATAGGSVAPTRDGVRVLFTPDRTDLSPDSVSSIKSYLEAVPKTDGTSFNVTAYAAGAPDDPSTPRRLSLSRALAVRSVLLAEGVASEHIYVRALGTSIPDGPPDRVDVAASGGGPGKGANAAGPAK